MQLSPNFTLMEFTKSQAGERMGIDNTPPPHAIASLKLLCLFVLEPVRFHYKRPVVINSGYRGTVLNEAVRGSISSQHCKGEAADIEVIGIANGDLAKWMANNVPYDQLILECYRKGEPTSGWVHVSYKPKGNRREKLTAELVNKKMVYSGGINP